MHLKTKILAALLLISQVFHAQKKEAYGPASFTIPANATGRAGDNNFLITATSLAESYYSIEISSPADSQGSLDKDFSQRWTKLTEKYPISQPAAKSKRPAPPGWTVQSALTSYESGGQKATLELVTYLSSGKSVSFVIISHGGLPHPDVDFFFSGLTMKPLTPQGPLAKPLTPQGPLVPRGTRTGRNQ